MGFDEWLMDLVAPPRRPGLSPLMVFVTHSGDIAVLLTLIAGGAVWMFRSGRRRAGWAMLCVGLASIILDTSIKFAVNRARPDVPWRLIDVPPYPSFPSGHAMGGLAVYATLGWILGRRWGLALGAAWGVLIGVSRVFVGVHHPTDVLAGLAVGAVIAAFAVRMAEEGGPRHDIG